MFPAPLFSLMLIVATPALFFIEGPIVHGLIIAAAAAAVGVVALSYRPGEAQFLSMAFKPVAFAAIVLAIWMLIQVLPVNAIGLDNPIWKSAAAALGRPLAGSISIDPGATLVCLARYLSVVAIAFVAAAVAVDRQRAEWIVIGLIAGITLVAIMVLADKLGGVAFLRDGDLSGQAATDIAGFGIIISLAAAMHMLERRKAQLPDQSEMTRWQSLSSWAWLVAVAICTLAFILKGTNQEFFAVACGVATLAVSVVSWRFYFGPWGYSAIISIAVVVAVAALALRAGNQSLDLTIAYAAHAPAAVIAVTQRVLLEAGWAGTGAGTFSAVLPIYEDINDLAVDSWRPLLRQQ